MPLVPRRPGAVGLKHCLALCLGLGLSSSWTASQAADKFVFLTDWYAQAEHGGYYQAQATGLYAKEGLDVTLKMGGPQVNLMQLLVAGQASAQINKCVDNTGKTVYLQSPCPATPRPNSPPHTTSVSSRRPRLFRSISNPAVAWSVSRQRATHHDGNRL